MSTTSASIVYNTPEVNVGVTTSWIPVTTPWPSSAGCESAFFLFPGNLYPVAWDPGYGYWVGGTPRCLPPAATTWWEQNHQGGDGFTSVSIRPIVCPAAFTTAATSVQSGSSTLVLCCPSGYPLQNGEPGRAVGTCVSALTPGQTISYLADNRPGVVTETVVLNSSSSIMAIPFSGWNVDTSTSNPSQSRSGLSTGAKAGIGVSAAIGAIGILALLCAFLLFRRRPKAAENNTAYPVQAEAKPVHEHVNPYVAGANPYVPGPNPYVPGPVNQYAHELGAPLNPTEMPSGN